MGSTVKVSNRQSLFASASLVTGLYTNTLVSTKPSKTTGNQHFNRDRFWWSVLAGSAA
jgi:hypothetical protein